jgi:type I site-specific restriction endonuclease
MHEALMNSRKDGMRLTLEEEEDDDEDDDEDEEEEDFEDADAEAEAADDADAVLVLDVVAETIVLDAKGGGGIFLAATDTATDASFVAILLL